MHKEEKLIQKEAGDGFGSTEAEFSLVERDKGDGVGGELVFERVIGVTVESGEELKFVNEREKRSEGLVVTGGFELGESLAEEGFDGSWEVVLEVADELVAIKRVSE